MSRESNSAVEEIDDTDYEVVDESAESALVPVNPDEFQSSGIAPVASSDTKVRTPWVGFYGAATKSGTDALKAAGVEVNQFYLFDQEPIAIKPFQIHLVKANQFFVQHTSDGKKILAASPVINDQLRDDGFRSLVTALVFVVMKTPTGGIVLVPSTMQLRGALDRALKRSLDLFDGQAKDKQAWGARSDKHAIAAQADWPGGRFRATIWGTTEDTQDGKNTYNLGHSTVAPTPAEGVIAFNKLVREEFQSRVAPAFRSFQYRVNHIEKIAEKTKASK